MTFAGWDLYKKTPEPLSPYVRDEEVRRAFQSLDLTPTSVDGASVGSYVISDLVAVPSTNELALSWTAPPAPGSNTSFIYNIKWGDTEAKLRANSGVVTYDTSYTIPNLTGMTTYLVSVQAFAMVDDMFTTSDLMAVVVVGYEWYNLETGLWVADPPPLHFLRSNTSGTIWVANTGSTAHFLGLYPTGTDPNEPKPLGRIENSMAATVPDQFTDAAFVWSDGSVREIKLAVSVGNAPTLTDVEFYSNPPVGSTPALTGIRRGSVALTYRWLMLNFKTGNELWRINPANPSDTTGDYGLVGTLPSKVTQPFGIAYGDGRLLLVDDTRNEVWRINPDNPSDETGDYGLVGTLPVRVLNNNGSIRTHGFVQPYGIAYGDGKWWVVDNSLNQLWRINPDDPSDTTGDYGYIGAMPSTGLQAPFSIGYGDGSLLVVDFTSRNVFRINPDNPSDTTGDYGLVGTLPAGVGCTSLSYGDGKWLIGDNEDDELWKLNPAAPYASTGNYGLLGTLPTGLTSPYGLAYVGVPPSPAPVTPTLSTDSTLSALTISVSTLSPEFAAGTTMYTADVANDAANITVAATASDADATAGITPVDSDAVAAGHQIDLGVGDTTITVLVTAENGTTNTYTITVTRAAATAANGWFAVTRDSKQIWRINPDNPSDETGDYGLVGTLSSSITSPSAIGYGDNRWLIVNVGKQIWRINLEDTDDVSGDYGSVGSLSGSPYLLGMGYGDSRWLGVDNADSSLRRINPDNPSDSTGDYGSVGTFPSLLQQPQGIGYGDGIWLCVSTLGKPLWRINPDDPDDESGDYGFLGAFPTDLSFGTGISYGDGRWLVVTRDDHQLWRINPANPSDTTGDYGLVGNLPSGMTATNGLTYGPV